ncbi:MAG: pyruvate kinase [Deltaproteobacteria bacterium]|nr:pyruvate kinase [Deltaproteobacteria bacterium]
MTNHVGPHQPSDLNPMPPVQGMRCFTEAGDIRRTKIVGTLGPASSDETVLRELFMKGLDIARLNFSHGDHAFHLQNIKNIRRISRETGNHVTILQDLQGPKIRCGLLSDGMIELRQGESYSLVYGTIQEKPDEIPVDYQDLVRDVRVGQSVMMDDGLLLLEITEVEGSRVRVRVTEGGVLKNRKGVNFPDSVLSLPALTEKDTRDLLFGITHRVDVVALSFVQTEEDIKRCRKIIQAMGSDVPIIAKIEKLSAVERIDAIAQEADGLMVARGDLGVEGGVDRVPMFQRRIIEAAARYAKPVVIATQMLESMVKNPRPTLAEVADVANAVLEGADCVMLSAEVAAGEYPIACVEKMASVIREVESWSHAKPQRYSSLEPTDQEEWEEHKAIARAACEAADSLGARAIVCLTLTGSIARLISSWRPKTPIIAISPREDVIQRLGYSWGVFGMKNPLFYDTDILLQDLPELLKNLGIVRKGDSIVITAGIPINAMRPTNMIKINRIG